MTIPKNASHLDEVQNHNRSLVLKTIHGSSSPTRISIAAATGLTRSTITNIVGDLIQYGLVKEGAPVTLVKGRRPVLLSLSDDRYQIIGIRITRAYCSIGVYGLSGGLRNSIYLPHPPGDTPETLMQALIQAVETLRCEGEQETIGIGVSMPGPIFDQGDSIPPIANFEGWERVCVQSVLGQAFAVPVVVEQDANAAALMEWRQRANDHEDMVYLDAGQGIGAGIIINGWLFRGARGGAGEVGHMSLDPSGPSCTCGSRGCLDRYCSTLLLLDEINRNQPPSSKEEEWTLQRMYDAFAQGNPDVKRILARHAHCLGRAVGNLINLFSPHVLVIAGEMAGFGQEYLEMVTHCAGQHALADLFASTSILLPALPKREASAAAANIILEALMQNPARFVDKGSRSQ